MFCVLSFGHGFYLMSTQHNKYHDYVQCCYVIVNNNLLGECISTGSPNRFNMKQYILIA